MTEKENYLSRVKTALESRGLTFSTDEKTLSNNPADYYQKEVEDVDFEFLDELLAKYPVHEFNFELFYDFWLVSVMTEDGWQVDNGTGDSLGEAVSAILMEPDYD